MGVIEIILISLGVAMDAFAVSICQGMVMKQMNWRRAMTVGTYFGGFQVLMPLAGFLLAATFASHIQALDHWIAFGLLGILGGKMLYDAITQEEACSIENENKSLFMLAIATSIDALAVGVTFAFLQVNLWLALLLIGVITFILCVIGVKIGHRFGCRFGRGAQIVGSLVLILLGIDILLEHLGIFHLFLP